MKERFLLPLLLGLVSCAASTPRTPASRGGFALFEKHYLICFQSDDLARHAFYLHHDAGHEFRFHYDPFDAPAWNTVATCHEKANGITCAVKGHPAFRLEYAFENHPAHHIEGSDTVALASFQEAQFGAKRFDCFISENLTDDFAGAGEPR